MEIQPRTTGINMLYFPYDIGVFRKLELDAIDILMLNWFRTFWHSGKMQEVYHDGKTYYMCNLGKLCSDMEHLGVGSKATASRHLQRLCGFVREKDKMVPRPNKVEYPLLECPIPDKFGNLYFRPSPAWSNLCPESTFIEKDENEYVPTPEPLFNDDPPPQEELESWFVDFMEDLNKKTDSFKHHIINVQKPIKLLLKAQRYIMEIQLGTFIEKHKDSIPENLHGMDLSNITLDKIKELLVKYKQGEKKIGLDQYFIAFSQRRSTFLNWLQNEPTFKPAPKAVKLSEKEQKWIDRHDYELNAFNLKPDDTRLADLVHKLYKFQEREVEDTTNPEWLISSANNLVCKLFKWMENNKKWCDFDKFYEKGVIGDLKNYYWKAFAVYVYDKNEGYIHTSKSEMKAIQEASDENKRRRKEYES